MAIFGVGVGFKNCFGVCGGAGVGGGGIPSDYFIDVWDGEAGGAMAPPEKNIIRASISSGQYKSSYLKRTHAVTLTYSCYVRMVISNKI